VGNIEYSVVIPSYNSEKTILRCLEALTAQIDPKDTEIIVVNSSQDATPRLIEEHYPQVCCIQCEERKCAGEARNIGVEKARGRILLFIDADCIANPDWASRMIEAHKDGKYAAVGGCIVNGNPEGLISWAGYFLEFSRFFMNRGPRREVAHQPTCSISYDRRTFEENGGFKIDMYPVEDRLFNEMLVQKGGKILFDPAIQVRHFHRTTFKALLRHQLNIGRGSVRMRRQECFKNSYLVKTPLWLPVLVPAMLAGRLGMLLSRLLFQRPEFLPRWLLSLPFYLLGLLWWIFGFVAEVCRPTEPVIPR
jgi:glycosyltransferase involved in cell wall biosynthesis